MRIIDIRFGDLLIPGIVGFAEYISCEMEEMLDVDRYGEIKRLA